MLAATLFLSNKNRLSPRSTPLASATWASVYRTWPVTSTVSTLKNSVSATAPAAVISTKHSSR